MKTPTLQKHIAVASFVATALAQHADSLEDAIVRIGGGFQRKEQAKTDEQGPKADFGLLGLPKEDLVRAQEASDRIANALIQLESLIHEKAGEVGSNGLNLNSRDQALHPGTR